jgi:hypothetical protein
MTKIETIRINYMDYIAPTPSLKAYLVVSSQALYSSFQNFLIFFLTLTLILIEFLYINQVLLNNFLLFIIKGFFFLCVKFFILFFK